MIELKMKDNEVDIQLKYYQPLGGKIKCSIYAEGDLSHHLIEGLFSIIDKLSTQENCSHKSSEWKTNTKDYIKSRMKEIY